MKLLSGQAEHTLDAKNRMRIPAKFRSAFPEGEQIYAIAYNEMCLFVMPESSLQKRIERLTGVTTANVETMNAMRRILSQIEELTEDAQGRTVLSQPLRQSAKIKKDIVSIGMGDHIEVWAKDLYEKEVEKTPISLAFMQLPF